MVLMVDDGDGATFSGDICARRVQESFQQKVREKVLLLLS